MLELKMSRRAGEIRSLGLNAKIGRDGTLDRRAAQPVRTDAKWSILHTSDAGALFRVHRRLFAHDRRPDGDADGRAVGRTIRRSRAP